MHVRVSNGFVALSRGIGEWESCGRACGGRWGSGGARWCGCMVGMDEDMVRGSGMLRVSGGKIVSVASAVGRSVMSR